MMTLLGRRYHYLRTSLLASLKLCAASSTTELTGPFPLRQEESTSCMILGNEAANEGQTRCPVVRRRYLLARCVMQDRANNQVSGRSSIVATQLPTYNDWSRTVTRNLVRAGNLFRHSSTVFW
jgi:hypothetical protein